MSKSYNDPVKQLAREKLRDFIKGSLISAKKPIDVYVVCFPGAEQEGEEALEIREVYDPLGIPRSNVVGLDYDPVRAERLRRANLGIGVVQSSDLDYFRTTDRRFDIISLDYTGSLSFSVLDSVDMIGGRELLISRGILSTNILAQRERSEYTRFMKGVMAYENALRKGNGNSLPSENILSKGRQEEIDRSEAITRAIKNALGGGVTNIADDIFFRSSPEYDSLQEKLIKKAERQLSDDIITDEERKLCEITLKKLKSGECGGISGYTEIHTLNCIRELGHLGLDPLMAVFFGIYANGGYFLDNMQRYRYRSNSGSVMFMDMMQVRPVREVIGLPEYQLKLEFGRCTRRIIIQGHEIDGPIEMKNQIVQKEIKQIQRKCKSKVDSFLKLGKEIPERIDLGSSYQTPKRKPRISKKDAIGLLEVGFLPEEILQEYRGFTKMQLAAFKAHLTIGTYKRTK